MSAAVPGWLAAADRTSPWQQLHATVAGLGVSGAVAARVLLRLGATVTVLDGGTGPALDARAEQLRAAGARVLTGPDADTASGRLPEGTGLVVTSPGWRPDAPLLKAATAAGVPVWGDVELAWRLRPAEGAAPWLCVTGTNGKTTTVQMLAAILGAAGLRAAAVGNVGTPVLDAVFPEDPDAEPYDVLAVELSSYQLHWSSSIRAEASAVLNLAPDHIDWHGSMEAYAADKGRIHHGAKVACVYNSADAATRRLVEEADVEEGCRAVGFTLGAPGVGELGVVDGLLIDRAFIKERWTSAAELASVEDIDPPAPHNVANALAAAALARAHGVPAAAVRDGLRAFRPDAHRIAHVATTGDGVAWVDDSKATNTHATAASLAAYPSVVWIAGGLAKGAEFDDLVAGAAGRLRGVVLIGRDRDRIRAALRRHAPEVPVVEVARTDTGAMEEVVEEAGRMARSGDTVLLAPACASMDMFANYGERGDAFAAAVHARHGQG
ncbi:UDP-N-acetylmuramoyl-L-alanine--D-glutamate ligase [Allostreptomyces psammosilenae]|uniref:UDP-N-acetylmuramoylalanine--D-glutamate ligase n=1 Tax=Allostreptomyces psammosilenae TaxID=1892865 RepID=A0A852ZY47_9ACTN|nr:UDP-N-acetylmuramoyl-L-alanine--D-glutamate ligase [Allostreptomyces psammosilenae]NYI07099.1 UDP-N-acetylmuramoylalanine--D-glutamate ligase [Allostreptomyces psammosilenae]